MSTLIELFSTRDQKLIDMLFPDFKGKEAEIRSELEAVREKRIAQLLVEIADFETRRMEFKNLLPVTKRPWYALRSKWKDSQNRREIEQISASIERKHKGVQKLEMTSVSLEEIAGVVRRELNDRRKAVYSSEIRGILGGSFGYDEGWNQHLNSGGTFRDRRFDSSREIDSGRLLDSGFCIVALREWCQSWEKGGSTNIDFYLVDLDNREKKHILTFYPWGGKYYGFFSNGFYTATRYTTNYYRFSETGKLTHEEHDYNR